MSEERDRLLAGINAKSSAQDLALWAAVSALERIAAEIDSAPAIRAAAALCAIDRQLAKSQ